MKFKVGDRVKVRENLKPNEYYSGVRFDSDMQKMKGRIVTIEGAFPDNSYWIEEYGYLWTDEMFEEIIYTYKDLKKSPIGTRVTFENGRTFVRVSKDDKKDAFTDLNGYRNIEDLKGLKDNFSVFDLGKIIKIEEPEYKTVYEYKPEILDKTEKRYLRGVIRPFRDKVEYIQKCKSIMYEESDYMNICIENSHSITLPYFKSNTMYKGMELNKHYTLEELGL